MFALVNKIWENTQGDTKLYKQKLNERTLTILKSYIKRI